MPLIDVTLGMGNGMIAFPDDPPFEMTSIGSISDGNPYNISSLKLYSHTGTHVDPPRHYFDSGFSVDLIPLSHLVGEAVILDMRGKPRIGAEDIMRSNFRGHSRVLFKTDNSFNLRNGIFAENFCHLTLDGAIFLVQNGIKLVGIDYLSIESFEASDGPVHKTILESGAVIVEALDLLDAPTGPCKVLCLPLKIIDADGAPARVLIEIQETEQYT